MTTPTDEDLIGYVLDALAPDERAAVAAHLRADPTAAARLDHLRRSLAPFELDRDSPSEPPPHLALRTVARLAEHLTRHEPPLSVESDHGTLLAVAQAMETEYPEPEPHPLAFPAPRPLRAAHRDAPEPRAVGGRFRIDLLVACSVALFACGLIVTGVGRLRAQSQVLACQDNLRTLHTGLTGYAETHAGQYPRVGTDANPTADTFVSALVDAGQVPAGFRGCCPADPARPAARDATPPVGYTYSLGYRAPTGDLLGLTRGTDPQHDLVPISADYPAAAVAPAGGPVCPHAVGMNVLYAGGNVRHATSALVGPNGDDIYRNVFGRVAAGADANDAVLGRPGDRP
ncbi:anti-sigma factor family protein [Gemmata sp.]|uniref:anti-sigma factor family protein n=1 Tax=Gemmata sp. TaxID=1914242 RepID=UPI003F6E8949